MEGAGTAWLVGVWFAATAFLLALLLCPRRGTCWRSDRSPRQAP